MFDKHRESLAASKSYQKVKLHLQENKNTYLLTVGAVGVFGAGMVTGGRRPEIQQIIKPKNLMGIGFKATQTMNTIVLPAKGDPGDVVQNIRTLDTYPSKGELARSLGIDRSRVADYFAGRSPHLRGEQFEVIGKAGHPISFA